MPLTLSEILAARGVVIPNPGSAGLGVRAVRTIGPQKTAELLRIKNLPRRDPNAARGLDLSDLFARPGGNMRLKWRQSATLAEAAEQRGLLAFLGVGEGKTLISELLPVAMEAERPILLIPASIRDQLLRVERPKYARSFRLHPNYRVIAYEELSLAKNSGLLGRLSPDLIVADEAHSLRHRDAARTRRFLRYLKDNHGVAFCALSGTLAGRSILDFGHLAGLALRQGSPLPLDRYELSVWAAAIDPHAQQPTGPGYLSELCAPGESVQDGFARRLLETPGVISSDESSSDAALDLHEHPAAVPATVTEALARLLGTWVSPGGDELEDHLALARSARQVSQGFFYVWRWPGGKADEEWLEARREWHRAIREFLKRGAREGLDSPLLIANACRRGKGEVPPHVVAAWNGWARVKHRPEPPVESVWIDRFLVASAASWAASGPPGIVWFEHRAVGEALREAGLRVFSAGPEARLALAKLGSSPAAGTFSIACSVKAHGTGLNLQKWARNLVLSPPSSGSTWEQLLGRTHRAGQEAPLVRVDVCRHTETLREAVAGAIANARFLERTTRNPQKLLFSRITWKR